MGIAARAWRAVRFRGPSTVAVLVAGVLACTAAALAPMTGRALDRAGLAEALRTAPADRLAVTVRATAFGAVADDPTLQPRVVAVLTTPDLGRWYAPARTAVISRDGVLLHGPRQFVGRLAQQDDACRDYGLASGRCPVRAGEAAVAAPDARRLRVRLGTVLRAEYVIGKQLPLRVVGTYRAPPAGALLGPASTATPAALQSGGLAQSSAPVLVSADDLANGLPRLAQTLIVRRDLRRAAVRVDGEDALRRAVSAVPQRVVATAGGWEAETPIIVTLDPVDAQRRLVAVTLPLVGLQVVLVVWAGLALLVRALSQARAEEWALAKLRGLGTAKVLWVALGPPAALLLLAAPIGLALASLLAGPVVSRVPGAASAVEPWRLPVLAAVGLALAGSLVALVAASAQALRAPVAQLLHRTATAGRPVSRLTAVVEVAVLVGAVAGVYQVTSGGDLRTPRADGLSLLTPALLAVAAGLVAVRVASLALRLGARRRGGRPATMLAGRRLANTPGALYAAVVLVAGVAVAVSAAGIASVAAHNRGLRAGQEIGADRVLRVRVPAGASLRDLVRSADPSGRVAMAVRQSASDVVGSTSLVLAVDSPRYAALARVEPAWARVTPARLPTVLRPPTSPSVRLRGRQVTMTLSGTMVRQLQPFGPAGAADRPVHLALTVDDGRRWATVDLGRVLPGDQQRLTTALPCRRGCRVVRLEAFGGGAPFVLTTTVAAVRTDGQPASALASALTVDGRWRPLVPGAGFTDPTNPPVTISASPDGLLLSLLDASGAEPPGVTVADVPFPLPALLARGTGSVPVLGLPGAVAGTGLDGASQPLQPVGFASVLPRMGRDGVVVDLGEAERASDPALRAGRLEDQVWLTASAPASVLRYLRAHHVRVLGEQTVAARERRLARATSAQAATVAAAAGAAGLVLALLVSVAALLLGARRRLYELASLRAAGVRTGVLRRSVVAEVVGLLGTATAVGTLAGWVATRLVLPRLPLFADAAGPPRDLSLGWLPVGSVPLAVLVVLAVGSVLLARALVGAAGPDRLRESLR